MNAKYSLYFLLVQIVFLTSCKVSQQATIDPNATHVTIPLTFAQGIPYLEMEIQGKQIPLKLDLGGFSTIALSDSLLRSMDLVITGSRTSNDAFGNRHTVRDYVIPEARIGGIALSSVEGSEDKSYLAPDKAGNGYLGYGLISKFKRVVIDYPAKQLTLSWDGSLPARFSGKEWTTIPFDDKGGVVAPMTLDGKELSFWWDTGANFSIIDPDLAIADRTRRQSNVSIYTPAQISLGGREMRPTEFLALELAGPGEDGLIGHSFFNQHVVLIDFETSTISVR